MPTRLLRRIDARHRAWRYRTRTDRHEIRWMRALLREGDVAVDVGAYKGGYTYWIRHEVGTTGHVYSFEPQAELATFIARGISAFGWHNVEVERLALSSTVGERVLHTPGDGPSQRASFDLARLGARKEVVPTDTLDAFLARRGLDRRVRFMKCDVEGHELDVFEGALETLRRDRPTLLFECEGRHNPTRPMSDVFDYLGGLNYTGSFFLAGERLALQEFDAERHQVLRRRPYGNNFVFEPQ